MVGLMGRALLPCHLILALTACGDCRSEAADRDASTVPEDGGAGDTGAPDAGPDAGLDAGPDRGPGLIELAGNRAACDDRSSLRNVYFGDLHIHTRFSFDAASYDVRTGPRDAYRFAKGEPIALPPYDATGAATSQVQLRRPLDFAAVTDHAELMAATSLCTDTESPAFESITCRSYREMNNPNLGFGRFFDSIGANPPRPVPFCRGDPAACFSELANVWQETIDAAEEFDDKSARCEFTTFVGYEWTGSASAGGQNIHRNVLFDEGAVLGRPISYVEASTPERLWDALEALCLDTDGACDVLAIPHNSNVGLGNMFNPITEAGDDYDASEAARRARLEPLVEIYQHKGSSECITNVGDPLASEDELCDFEIFYENICTSRDQTDCVPLCDGTGRGSSFLVGRTCVSPGDYVRGALRRGLSEFVRVGVNPFQLGVIASTDTHSSTGGAVDEADWSGHTGDFDDELEERLRPTTEGVAISVRTSSPGGLAAVWAEENSRPALFEAMRRRETYGTSGTRIAVRFFGGWDYSDSICDEAMQTQLGYDDGVPMGGVLPTLATAGAPVFFANALRDPQSAPLQRIQIVKGWVNPATGETSERVYEIAGEPDNGATVESASCETRNPSDDLNSLCGRWVDPDFNPAHPAFYYARVIENPTCRWSHRECVDAAVDCSTDPQGPLAACCDGSIPTTIQERAWTSPIWYLPPSD